MILKPNLGKYYDYFLHSLVDLESFNVIFRMYLCMNALCAKQYAYKPEIEDINLFQNSVYQSTVEG